VESRVVDGLSIWCCACFLTFLIRDLLIEIKRKPFYYSKSLFDELDMCLVGGMIGDEMTIPKLKAVKF
jgi:hypothetical protein